MYESACVRSKDCIRVERTGQGPCIYVRNFVMREWSVKFRGSIASGEVDSGGALNNS